MQNSIKSELDVFGNKRLDSILVTHSHNTINPFTHIVIENITDQYKDSDIYLTISQTRELILELEKSIQEAINNFPAPQIT